MTTRIAVAGFVQETLARSPFLTDESMIQVRRGQELYGTTNYRGTVGALDRLGEDADVETVPLLFARSLSGGSVRRDVYEAIKAETVELLRGAGPLDGLVLLNHGALEVDGFDVHGDTDFTLAVREAVGPGVPIGVPFDMHGQLTPEMLAELQAVTVLRTAPHRDQYEAGYRVADQVVRAVKGETRPTRAYAHLPMFIPGEKCMTAYSPARELWGSLPSYDARPGVIEANILLGFGWNDRPWVGTQAVIVTDDDEQLARDIAAEIARDVWARRHEFVLRMENMELDEGLSAAAEAAERPTYVTDSGDNVSAGAGGDLTVVLQHVLDHPELDDVVVAGILAPRTVRACREAGIGATVRVELGAEHLDGSGPRRVVEAVVEDAGDEIVIPNPVAESSTPTRSEGAWVRLRIGSALVTMHAVRLYIGQPGMLEAMGIDPVAHAVYVLKFGYLLPQLEDVAARFILLRSPGPSAVDFGTLAWERIARPAIPMDRDATWDESTAVRSFPSSTG
ncbi:M81 family metallopeptidase [Microbacterium sp. ET2]|uniref:M81 family metallopeptidase n=1 Tax=Microbacterium albipurpureum TaxID=3050384 RepID=UPI00259C8F6A|nr:M81 family metallopeptidase [Microbacterium sp. ET2 (Ac-2212)]WJL96758.1 M81 family metallopeptidase [Microbacterium sp. ET2 (Ac-2212)]